MILLRADAVFRLKLKDGKKLIGRVRFGKEGEEPAVDFDQITVGRRHEGEVGVAWTEHAPGGWSRRRETVLDLRAPGLHGAQWRVTQTAMTGGGTGMGPHDVYPDGHRVLAVNVERPSQTLAFYQTGCFTNMVDPDELEVVAG